MTPRTASPEDLNIYEHLAKERPMRDLYDPTVDSTPLPQQYRCTPVEEARGGNVISILAGGLYGLIVGVPLGALAMWGWM